MLGSVGAACIAGIASFFTCMALAAQAPSDVALKVKVTDTTGTAISRAKIQARTPDSRIKSETQTDSRGEAVLYLDRETSIVSVHAPGFEVWQYQIEGGKDVDKQLIAVLRIESYYGPTLVNPEPRLETGHPPPIAATIPLEPLESLVNLPGRKLRPRGKPHYRVD